MKKVFITIGIILFIVGLLSGIATGISRKNREINPVRIDYQKSFFHDYNIENNIVNMKCELRIYNVNEQDKKFHIRAKSPEDVGKLLHDENLRINENGQEKVFELKANESSNIDVVFEGEFGGTNQKLDRELPNEIEIIYIDK